MLGYLILSLHDGVPPWCFLLPSIIQSIGGGYAVFTLCGYRYKENKRK